VKEGRERKLRKGKSSNSDWRKKKKPRGERKKKLPFYPFRTGGKGEKRSGKKRACPISLITYIKHET